MSSELRNEGDENTHILVPEIFLCDTLDLVYSNSIDSSLDLLRSEPPSARDELTTNILSNGGGSIETQKETSLELALSPLDFDGSRSNAHTRPLPESKVQEVVQVHQVLRYEVDTPQTGVRVRCGERHERVGKVVLRNDV